MISGLDIPEITPDLLQQITCSYNVGPLPIINGKLWNPIWEDSYRYRNVTVEIRRNSEDNVDRWRILEGSMCLSKSGNWLYDGVSSLRTKKFIKYCRFDTAEDAIRFYFEWKENIIKRAEKILKKNPEAILNF